MIEVLVNNKPYYFFPDISLQHLLQEIQQTEPKGIAAAINDEVIPKGNWSPLPAEQHRQGPDHQSFSGTILLFLSIQKRYTIKKTVLYEDHQDVRDYASKPGMQEDEALKKGMEEKAREFAQKGSEIYL